MIMDNMTSIFYEKAGLLTCELAALPSIARSRHAECRIKLWKHPSTDTLLSRAWPNDLYPNLSPSHNDSVLHPTTQYRYVVSACVFATHMPLANGSSLP